MKDVGGHVVHVLSECEHAAQEGVWIMSGCAGAVEVQWR